MRAAHLSDLHIGSRISREKLEALRADLAAHSPDLLILSGDITDRGRLWQFRWADGFLRSLHIPFISVPGNREVSFSTMWEWMIPPLAMPRYSGFFGEKDRVLYSSEEHRIVFFGLNSVHAFAAWPGSIARETRYWLKAQAPRFADYFKGLFLHHPVLPVIRSSSFWAHNLADAGEVLNICTQTGISLILQGHKHRAAVMEVSFPERNAKVVVSSCGAPLMPYWDSIYPLIDILPDSIVIQPREFIEGTFSGQLSHRFPVNSHRIA